MHFYHLSLSLLILWSWPNLSEDNFHTLVTAVQFLFSSPLNCYGNGALKISWLPYLVWSSLTFAIYIVDQRNECAKSSVTWTKWEINFADKNNSDGWCLETDLPRLCSQKFMMHVFTNKEKFCFTQWNILSRFKQKHPSTIDSRQAHLQYTINERGLHPWKLPHGMSSSKKISDFKFARLLVKKNWL